MARSTTALSGGFCAKRSAAFSAKKSASAVNVFNAVSKSAAAFQMKRLPLY